MRFPTLPLLITAALLSPLPALAQGGDIAGTVVEAVSGRPIDGALVEASRDDASGPWTAHTDVAGRFRLEGLEPGSYRVQARRFEFREAGRDAVMVRAGETSVVDLRLAARVFAGETITVSASRKPETLWDAPATVAVIDSATLSARPAVSPADHLQAVPGVDQIRYGLQSSNIVTRGFNNLFSGAMRTLTDYRIASVPSLRVNLLHLEPTTNEDLDRMEVVLGPGAALYGPNTANGVLHILTRSPLDDPGSRVSVTGGERGVLQTSFRSAQRWSESFGVKVSGQYQSGEEWPFIDPVEEIARDSAVADPAACRAAWLAGGVDPLEASRRCERVGRRAFDVRRWTMDARADWRPGAWDAVLSGGLARAADGIELTGIGAAQAVDWTKYYVQARAVRGRFFGQVYLNGSDAGNTYLLQNGASIRDRSKLFVTQVQHGFSAGDRQSFTYGLDYLLTLPETGGTINGRYEDDDRILQVGGYLQSETELTPRLDLILAGRIDRTTALEDVVFSPRAGITFEPTAGHTFRLTYNRAVETPTTLNMFLDIHAGGVPDPALAALGYGMRAQGPGFDGLDLVDAGGWPCARRSTPPGPARCCPWKRPHCGRWPWVRSVTRGPSTTPPPPRCSPWTPPGSGSTRSTRTPGRSCRWTEPGSRTCPGWTRPGNPRSSSATRGSWQGSGSW
jgi:outer membrane receptor for ferrienterochelin and colicins